MLRFYLHPKPFVHLIGNLSLITSQANSAINNDSYSTKILTYANEASSFPQMKDLVDNHNLPDSNSAKWKFDKITKDDYSCVTKRAKALSDKAWNVWIDAIANY